MKAKLDRREFGLGAVAAATLAATGPIARARAQSTSVRIGNLLPRSGFLALVGQGCQRGVDLAKPILGDLGYSFEIVDADTESKTDVARTQAERLIRDGCHILTGAFESGQTLAIAQVCEQHGIPFVVNIAADPAITEQGYKTVFRNFPTAPMLVGQGLALFGEIFRTSGTTPKTAVLMRVNDTFGNAMGKGIRSFSEKVGLPFKIVDEITYDPQAKDLSIEVAKAKAAGADLHMVVTRLNDAILMVREMVKQKYEPMGIISPGSPGMYERPFLKVLGKYSDYCITNVAWFDPRQPLVKPLEAAFLKAYPEESFDLNIGFCFEGVLICADAARRAGSTRPEALIEALRATDLGNRVMMGGAITFDGKGQNTHLPSASVQDFKGRPTVVLPGSNAEAKLVFPMPGWSQRS